MSPGWPDPHKPGSRLKHHLAFSLYKQGDRTAAGPRGLSQVTQGACAALGAQPGLLLPSLRSSAFDRETVDSLPAQLVS